MNRAAILAALVVLFVVSGCGAPSPQTPAQRATSAAPSRLQTVPTPSPKVSVDAFAPDGWVNLSTVDSTILVEIRYQGRHNFVGRPIDGYLDPVCLLPDRTAQALHRAQVAARAEGYSLKVYECYRPQRASADLLRWRDDSDESMRAEFYPSLAKRDLFDRHFIANRSLHSSGTAVDVTLVHLPVAVQPVFQPGDALVSCTAPAGERFRDNSVDMGTGYDCFDALSHPDDPRVTPAARENRARLHRLMAGFIRSTAEWWHFELADPAFRGQYFDFPVARAALT